MISVTRLEWVAIHPGPHSNDWAVIEAHDITGAVIASGLTAEVATMMEGLPDLIRAAQFAEELLAEGPAKLKLRSAVAKALGND